MYPVQNRSLTEIHLLLGVPAKSHHIQKRSLLVAEPGRGRPVTYIDVAHIIATEGKYQIANSKYVATDASSECFTSTKSEVTKSLNLRIIQHGFPREWWEITHNRNFNQLVRSQRTTEIQMKYSKSWNNRHNQLNQLQYSAISSQLHLTTLKISLYILIT